MNMKIPYGTVVIDKKEYERLILIDARMATLSKRVIKEYERKVSRNYIASLYCEELADIIGIELPVIETKEGGQNEE